MNALTPAWALSLAYWLHMLATVTWIGGLAAISLFVLPAARRTLDAGAYASFLQTIQKRLDPIAWLSLVILIATGMLQMSANPNYQGFLAIDNRWAAAILAKHLVILIMIGVSAYLTWGLIPRLQRLALRQARGLAGSDDGRLQKQEVLFLRLNLILGVVVLALTAVARAA